LRYITNFLFYNIFIFFYFISINLSIFRNNLFRCKILFSLIFWMTNLRIIIIRVFILNIFFFIFFIFKNIYSLLIIY